MTEEKRNELEKLPEFLPEMLKKQYGEALTEKIVAGYGVQRVVSLRVNTLKSSVDEVKKLLDEAGIVYEAVPWSSAAFLIKNVREQEIQKLSLYEEGKIYLQSLSSMLPPIILEPQAGKDILDMAAAPGGKTTQMAALTGNQAHITACEMNTIRAERLKYNLQKQGASCVYTMVKDSRQIDDFFAFDQILLDAPCSGSGTLSVKDPNLGKTFTKKLIQKSTVSQLALLKKALKLLKKGQTMVYSTCSILSQENEEILKKAMAGVQAEIVPISFEGMETLPCLPTSLKGTLCICPNEQYEGFFVAKIRKK
ncbi:MAG: RsmB/NOP family class I SAM-dependent RNA methyltransferase [Lachnospiraceae bacterium]